MGKDEKGEDIPLVQRIRQHSTLRKDTIKIRKYQYSAKRGVEETDDNIDDDVIDEANEVYDEENEEYEVYDAKLHQHYTLQPADLDGVIDFQDSPRKSTSKFVRFDHETKEEHLYDLLTKHWGLKKPTLLISVTGGAKSFDIPSRLKRDFVEGLRKVASTPGAWVISGGTDTGVMKMVGDANRGTENTCIGVVTWGVLHHRDTLEAKEEDNVHYYPRDGSYLNLPEGESYLDENHTHFLLVDDGTVGNWGVEIEFRNKFEAYIMKKRSTPTILLVIEGGPGTFKTVNLAIETKTPCVIIKGSGRAANVVAFACEFAEKIIADWKSSKKIYPPLADEIRHVVSGPIREDKIKELFNYALNCAENKAMFTIVDEENGLDTDDAILTALLNDTHAHKSLYNKLRFTLLWNRVDLAERMLGPLNQWVADDKVNSEGETSQAQGQTQDEANQNLVHELEPTEKHGQNQKGKEELERLVILALAMNNVQFVRLLIDYGVSLRSLLTRQVLEILYAYRWPTRPSALREFDEGEITTECVDTGQCTQERIDFYASIYQCLDSSSLIQYLDNEDRGEDCVLKINLNKIETHVKQELLGHVPSAYLENIIIVPENLDDRLDHPYRQLFVWAVFNNMREMAVYLWQFVNECISTSLLAVAITDNMRKVMRSRLHNVQDNEEELLTNSLTTYKDLSTNLLDTCHKDNEYDTVMLVTRKSDVFSGKCSALDFAFSTCQKEFVAHRAIQDILDDEWYGSIKSNHSTLRIFATIFNPYMLLVGMIIQPPRKGRINQKISFLEKFKHFHVDSPVVRFQTHTLGYIMFLCLFAYVAMSHQAKAILDFWEILLIVTVTGYAVHEINQMTHVQVPTPYMKVRKYLSDKWNLFDLLCIITFYVGLVLRCFDQTLEVGHVMYAIDVGFWIVRIIQVLYVDPISGPYVVIIGKLFKNFLGFLGILLIVLVSYGVTVRAILEPGPGHHQMLVAAVYKPYFHLFGELFLEEPPQNATTRFGTPATKYNNYGEPIALVLLGAYLLTANIVLLNLLIAIFSSTYEKMIPNASRMWKFQRYKLILEYATQRTVLFPPFNLLEHFCLLVYHSVKYCLSKCKSCTNIERKKSHHSKAILSVKHMKRKNKETDTELDEVLGKLERRSFNKVIRRREGLELAEKEDEGGAGGMPRNELEKHFLYQQENLELLERRMASIQTLIEGLKPKPDVEDESVEKEQETRKEEKYNKIERKNTKRAQERWDKLKSNLR